MTAARRLRVPLLGKDLHHRRRSDTLRLEAGRVQRAARPDFCKSAESVARPLLTPDGPVRGEAAMLRWVGFAKEPNATRTNANGRRSVPMLGRATAAVCLAVASLCLPAWAGSAPENLARKAKATASSEYSNSYVARFACDGKIPAAGDRADVGKAWVAKGSRHPGGVLYTLEWAEPVTVAETVYYGRTSFDTNENWKDYEVRPCDRPACRRSTRSPGRASTSRMSITVSSRT